MLNEALQKMRAENFKTEEILKDLIEEDLKSDAKKKMAEGVDYYNNEPAILGKDFRVYHVDGVEHTDHNKGNEKVINNFHKLLVDQKASYIAGNPIVLEVTNSAMGDDAKDGIKETIEPLLGEVFEDSVVEWITGASNKAWEALHFYIDEEGELKYEVISAEQLIPIYDTAHEKKLSAIIRYYEVEVVSKGEDGMVQKDTRYAAEWWTDVDVTYYIQNEHEEYIKDDTVDPNPAPHFFRYNTTNKNAKTGESWGKVPFIILQNNSNKKTDLEPIKSYIDAYDAVSSGFLNDLKDVQMAIWLLKGYEGTDMSEFMRNLIVFKAIKVAADEGAGIEAERMEIPYQARQVLLELLDNKIYSIGQGVDLNKLVENTSGVALKILFSGLDMKANSLIRKLKVGLQDMVWFVCEYLKRSKKAQIDYKILSFVIDKSTIFNQKELCENIAVMAPFMSKATAVANNPFVEDSRRELEQMEKEEKAEIEAYNGGVGKGRDDEEGNDEPNNDQD